jgi:ubiquinone/menaquinone biosynthesis C-methylase UbiE
VGVDIRRGGKPTVRCDAHHLPFRDEVFDICEASEVLEHLHDPLKGLAEMRRVLKTGMKLFVTVPNAAWFPVVVNVARSKHNSVHPEHFNTWNYADLKHLLGSAGFNILHCSHFTRAIGCGKLPKIAYLLRAFFPTIMNLNIMIIGEKDGNT